MQPDDTEAPTAAVRVPRRVALERPPGPADLGPLLRRRLILVALLVAGSAAFFAAYRVSVRGQWEFFLASWTGTALVIFEAALCAAALAVALVLWRRPAWSAEALRAVEFSLVGCVALYVGWAQLFAWTGARFALSGTTPLDPFLVRQAVDSMASRWMALIVGVSTLVPETPRRNAALVALLATSAMALTAYLGVTDPAYRPHLAIMLSVMGFWMALAGAIGIFGSYKLAELREQVHEAQQFGHYRLVRRIGAGNMGEVYLAEHLLLRQPCAIKLIRPERAADAQTLTRFEREVQATSRLNHWNNIRIYDYGYTDEGTFYYVMEYLSGWTLEDLVRQHGPLPAGRVVHLVRQVCAALREAHGIGLVHRDIKPANIIACCRGGVPDLAKLLDFGLVRVIGRRERSTVVTMEGQLAGTPAYMPPEQAAGDPVDGRSDIYSLGAVTYFLLTGQPPFVRSTSMQVMMAHVQEPPVPPGIVRPGVPPDLEAVVLRCLDKDADRRFPTVQALETALAGCASAGTWTEADAEAWWQMQPMTGPHAAAASVMHV